MSDYIQAIRLFHRDLRRYLLATFTLGFGFFGIYALLLNLYLLRLGYGPQFLGLVNGVAPLGFAVVSLGAGAVVGRLGFRRTQALGLSIDLIGLALLPFAEFVPPAWQASWLVLANLLSWIGGALYVASGSPFIMRITTPREREHAFAVQSAIIPVSGFLGNLVGGVLPGFFAGAFGLTPDSAAPYRVALWFGALFLLPSVLLLLSMSPISPAERQDATRAGGRPPVGVLFFFTIVMLLRTASEWVVRIFFNAYLDTNLQVPTAMIGLLFAGGQLLGMCALLAPAAVQRWGKQRLIGWSMVLMALSILPLALIPHWAAAGLSFMGVIGLISLATPAFFILSQESVAEEWRTTMSGAMTMAIGLSIGPMALGGGYMADALGYQNLFLLGAGLVLAAALIFMTNRRGRPVVTAVQISELP